jgi:hypothetical protein
VSFLLSPIPIQAFTNAPVFDAGFPVSNLANPQPKVVYRTSAAPPWAHRITADLGTNYLIDTIALLFHSGPATGLFWSAWSRTAAQGDFGAGTAGESDAASWFQDIPAVAAPHVGPVGFDFVANRFHSLYLRAGITARYVRVAVASNTAAPPFSAGVLAVGRRFEPQNGGAGPGADWGLGRRIVDLSDVRTLDGGEGAVWRKGRVPEVRWSWSHLTDAETRDLWAIKAAHGESRPLLFVEDPAATPGQQERIHYGTLRSLAFYERQQSDKSRWEGTLRGWL